MLLGGTAPLRNQSGRRNTPVRYAHEEPGQGLQVAHLYYNSEPNVQTAGAAAAAAAAAASAAAATAAAARTIP